MIGKIRNIIVNNKKQVIVSSFFIAVLFIFFIGSAFAALTPTKSVIINSENTSYQNNEAGSWQVEKSAKWISKGKARVSFDVDTTLMTKENINSDIIMVLDISASMSGNKLDRVKQDSIELVDSVLADKNNNIALITFETESTIVSQLTNDKDMLINKILDLRDTGGTSYYQALVNVDNILKNYVQQDNREVIVLFLTDGYPNIDTPNQVGQFQYLKKAYPYITVNGIQYEMGNDILTPIKEVSDDQFFADRETLNNVLFDASTISIPYENFQIVDYIDNRYFTLNSEDDITVSRGKVKLEQENGKQKIIWTIDDFNSGRNAKLTMDIDLKEEYVGEGGVYPTNEKEEIISKIVDKEESVSSTQTPVLAENYQVIYEGNAPDGASVSNVPAEVMYSVFSTAAISTEEPICEGYEFKGWEIVTKNVIRTGDDYFIMPEEDVVLRAKWSKVEIAKSMDGTVSTQGEPIMKGSSWWNTDYAKQKVTSIEIKNSIDVPDTAIAYWDASQAQDKSVVAYIEDDGNGDYKVSIGGWGGVVANTDCTSLFYGFANVKTLNLNNFDTSRVTIMQGMFGFCGSIVDLDLSNFNTSNVINMQEMFLYCQSLTNIKLASFDTSKVTNMSSMFYGCIGLTNLDLSNFDTSNVTNMNNMFDFCQRLYNLDMRNAVFNATSHNRMFGAVGVSDSGVEVIVRDSTAYTWMRSRLEESGVPYFTVTIADTVSSEGVSF